MNEIAWSDDFKWSNHILLGGGFLLHSERKSCNMLQNMYTSTDNNSYLDYFYSETLQNVVIL